MYLNLCIYFACAIQLLLNHIGGGQCLFLFSADYSLNRNTYLLPVLYR